MITLNEIGHETTFHGTVEIIAGDSLVIKDAHNWNERAFRVMEDNQRLKKDDLMLKFTKGDLVVVDDGVLKTTHISKRQQEEGEEAEKYE